MNDFHFHKFGLCQEKVVVTEPEETIDFTCPRCGHRAVIEPSFAGQTGPCAACEEVVTIPTLEEIALARTATPHAGEPYVPAGVEFDLPPGPTDTSQWVNDDDETILGETDQESEEDNAAQIAAQETGGHSTISTPRGGTPASGSRLMAHHAEQVQSFHAMAGLGTFIFLLVILTAYLGLIAVCGGLLLPLLPMFSR